MYHNNCCVAQRCVLMYCSKHQLFCLFGADRDKEDVHHLWVLGAGIQCSLCLKVTPVDGNSDVIVWCLAATELDCKPPDLQDIEWLPYFFALHLQRDPLVQVDHCCSEVMWERQGYSGAGMSRGLLLGCVDIQIAIAENFQVMTSATHLSNHDLTYFSTLPTFHRYPKTSAWWTPPAS